MRERKSTRLQKYDYSSNGLYFITSCVKDRVCCFGKVENGQITLSELGKIAEQQWYWLTQQYGYIKSHAFVVMPNHVHGVIEIKAGTGRDPSAQNVNGAFVGTGRDLSLHRDPSLHRDQPIQTERNTSTPEKIKIKSLSQLIGAYKTTSSKQIHLLENIPDALQFEWQRSFHDHIIKDQVSYTNIKNYINNNVAKWQEDTFYSDR